MKHRLVALFILLLCAGSAALGGGNGIQITVTTPLDYTATSRSESEGQRTCVTGNGSFIDVYNLTINDSVTYVKDTSLPAPDIRYCNFGTSNLHVTFYSCADGGCNCTGTARNNVITVTLANGECGNSGTLRNCAAVTP